MAYLAQILPVNAGGTGNSSQTAYSLIVGGTTSTGPFQSISAVASGQVLVSGGTSTIPAFSAYPQVSGLGIGASPGSTAGITFDGSNFLNTYSSGTFTPTVQGGTSAGTTTYSAQNGYYTRIGNLVTCQFLVTFSAATGTGIAEIGGLPFTIKNQTGGEFQGQININNAVTFPTGTTYATLSAIINTTTAKILCAGSANASASLQLTNTSQTYTGTLTYQI